MIAVIFEVEPAPGRAPDYLGIAADLRPLLDGIDGFLSIERFESLAQPGRYLSLSFWRDEAAVARWRGLGEHRQAQAAGRGGVLGGYRLRVARVVRDYGMTDRAEAPADCRIANGSSTTTSWPTWAGMGGGGLSSSRLGARSRQPTAMPLNRAS